ncbi:MAG: PKD domain-containing protein, partial [Bacteroidota bacterium]
ELNPDITPPDFSKLPKDLQEQKKAGWKTNTKATLKNFAGQNSGYYPPDCNGTVGADYYFQVVNTTYAIYDKVSEAVVAGPSNLNSIFNASLPGAGCNNGDPIVLWDEHANRWFYAEFSLCTSNDYMLIAVSQTDDPTGSWYSWSFDVDDMPDYMKFGIWQDGYYMATNTSPGNDVYVFERDVMIAGGASPTMIGFDNPNRPSTFDGFHCILPLDNDSTWAPTGDPGQFITIADNDQSNPADALWVYELDADWVTPGNSTFARTQIIPVNSFAGNFTGDWNNIPQNGTSQRLDGLSTILMYRAQYRNFGSSQRLVVAHAIAEASDEAALRWYELVNTGSGWSIRQQSTYNPDNISRWNMSIAMNGSYEIGIGYSVSNTSMYPGIRYIGQSATANAAANNTLDMAETTIWDGSYSQSGINRWGDYSNISIDPTDDHTFWYTNEYVAMSTHGTRIASFQFSTPTGEPIANFIADDVNPVQGQTVAFTDLSTNTPTSWAWSFSPATITYVGGTDAATQNPQVTFDATGLYTVTLIATNADGSDDEIKVDYINVTTCQDPTNLNATTITSTSADLNWTAGVAETSWNIEYGLQGYTQGTGTQINGVTNPYTLSGLTLNTSYDYYVQADCSSGYTSNWVGPFAFTTTSCAYCYSWGNTIYDTSTTRVIFNTIDNSSAKPTDGNGNAYSDYTATSTDVYLNNSYDLSTYVNTAGNYWVYTKAWIDWNQDCDFDDAGEEYDLGRIKNKVNAQTNNSPLSITVPLTATLGNTVLRVSTKFNSYATACEIDFDGEVEDYTLNILFACTGDTKTWDGSVWSPPGEPNNTNPIIIDADYNTSIANIEACECQVNAGVTLTVEAGDYISVENAIVNEGMIIINHEGSLVQTDDAGVNSGTGSYNIHKTTRPYTEYDYTYWSSPVIGETIGNVFNTHSSVLQQPTGIGFSNLNNHSLMSNIFWFDTSEFLDSDGDTFDDNLNDWIFAPASEVMPHGRGYIAMGAGSDWPFNTNFATELVQSVYFESSQINNGLFTYTLELDGGVDGFNNQNLVGNPYASAIDLQLLRNDADNNDVGSNTGKIIGETAYFWSHDTQITAGGGPWAYNFTNADYATLNIPSNTGSAAHSLKPTIYLASCQSIMLEANYAEELTFKNSMRVTQNNGNFFNPFNTQDDKLWLNMTASDGLFRQLAIVFIDGADDSINEYDSKKILLYNEADFYSLANGSADRLVIQGLAPFSEEKVVSLGLEILTLGNYAIDIDHVEGVFNTQNIYLKDY